MQDNQRLIFISNDDGYSARGLHELISVASEYGYVFAVAPSQHQSGKSSSITIDTPLRATLVESDDRHVLYQVNGTPTDCTKLAFNMLLPRWPDLVLAGINHGYNAGNSVIYSGTMGIVFEGCFAKLPSVGFSYEDMSADADFLGCVAVMRRVIDYVLGHGLPECVGLNVNIPKTAGGAVKGIRMTRASRGRWVEEFERRTDPFGRNYYWMTGRFNNLDADNPDGDLYQLSRGYASITPCHPEQTVLPLMRQLRAELECGDE